MTAEVVESPAPANCSGGKYPGSTGSLVNRGVRKVRSVGARSKGGVRQQRVRATHDRGGRVLTEPAIGFVPNYSWYAITILEPSPGIHPVPAVGNHVGIVAPCLGSPKRLVNELDARQCLLRSVERWVAPFDSFQGRVRYWVKGRISVTNDHAVRDPDTRRLEASLPLGSVGAEEAKIDAGIACGDEGVIHWPRPIFVVADREDAEVIQQHPTVCVRVDIGCVCHVISGFLHPADEGKLPYEEGLAPFIAGAVAMIGPVEGDFHSIRPSTHGCRAITVEGVEALARLVVEGIVVVGLIRRHRLLI